MIGRSASTSAAMYERLGDAWPLYRAWHETGHHMAGGATCDRHSRPNLCTLFSTHISEVSYVKWLHQGTSLLVLVACRGHCKFDGVFWW
jgi:hypothetical protein